MIQILIFCLVIFLLHTRYSVHPYGVWKRHGVDGPPPIPFFGNTFSLFNPNVGSRIILKQWQEKYGRTYGCYIFRKPVLVVNEPEMLKEVFVKQFHNLSDRFLIGDGKLFNRIVRQGLFFEYGQDWHRIRRILTPTFSGSKLRQIVHYINRNGRHLSENLKKSASDNKTIAGKDVFGSFALDVIAGMIFGLNINSQQNFDMPFITNVKRFMTFGKSAQLKRMLVGMFPVTLPIFEYFNIEIFDKQSCSYFEKTIYSLIEDRKNRLDSEKPQDFLQLLLNAEMKDEDENTADKKLSTSEVAAQSIIFIIAGYETTATVLQYISYNLARNKAIQNRLYEEIQEFVGNQKEPTYDDIQNLKYMSAVIYETLRMYPPLHLLSRQVDKACILNVISLPANSAIMIPVFNIGRDPTYFEEPDIFNPDRFLNDESQLSNVTFLPFGFGPRHCIGMRLALLEMKLALVHMLRHVIVQDVTPKILEFDDIRGLLSPKLPIQISLKLR